MLFEQPAVDVQEVLERRDPRRPLFLGVLQRRGQVPAPVGEQLPLGLAVGLPGLLQPGGEVLARAPTLRSAARRAESRRGRT